MTLCDLERLARAATPAGGGDISPFLDACSPERILALVAVARAAKDEQTARTFHRRPGEDDHGHGVTSCSKCGITVHVCQCQRSGHSYIKECVGCALAALEKL